MADIVEQDIVDRAMELVCAGWLDPEEASAALSDCADELIALRARCERYRKALEWYACLSSWSGIARFALQEEADE